MEQESKGVAERIVDLAVRHADHLWHNRPGIVSPDERTAFGYRWAPATHKVENGIKVAYELLGQRRRIARGQLRDDGTVVNGGRPLSYRQSGIFPEAAVWLYSQIAEIWKLDNEFAARWASYAAAQEHRDLKVALAAFLLVQSRKGDAEKEGDQVLFFDVDYRAVGEAMVLREVSGRHFNPKMILRVRKVLETPEIAELNRSLGFGRSLRRPFLGRWPAVTRAWLRFREHNPQMLQGLMREGFRTSLIELAKQSHYKPESEHFFEILKWSQVQAPDGRRTIAVGKRLGALDSWEELSEQQICEKIVREKPGYKVIASKVPIAIGITRAIMAAAIEAGSLSDKDLIIATPTLEQLGLLQVQSIKERWDAARKVAEDSRALNIARNVQSEKTREELEEASDTAAQKAVEEVVRGMRVYVFVDISGSMERSIVEAKEYLEKFVQAFPLDRLHVAVFHTVGREVTIRHPSAAGVRNAFEGITAGGGTSYGHGVLSLARHKPNVDEDVLFIFVGDELAHSFAQYVRDSELRPMAFGFIKTEDPNWLGHGYPYNQGRAVQATAGELGIPCVMLDQSMFADPYAIPRTLRALVASTPVSQVEGRQTQHRKSLVDTILETPILQKPVWA